VLRKGEERDADKQKDGELYQDDDAAGEKRFGAVAVIARCQKALNDGLIGAVAGHRQRSTADEAGPECVFPAEAEGKIKYLQFVASSCGDLRHFGPAVWNAMEQDEKSDDAAGDIQEQLRNVGPDDRAHAAFEGVEDGERDDNQNGETLGSAEDHADHKRDGGNAHTFGYSAGNEKGTRSDGAHLFPEALFDERIGSEKCTTKVAREQKQYDKNAADDVSDDQLEESHVARISDSGSADDGERGSFRRDDGECQSPPGCGAAAEKVLKADGNAVGFDSIALAAAEMHAQSRDNEQIKDDDGEIERMNEHLRDETEARIVVALTEVKEMDAVAGASCGGGIFRPVAAWKRACGSSPDDARSDACTRRRSKMRTFAHLMSGSRRGRTAFSLMLFVCASFWGLTAAGRRPIVC